MPKLDITVLKDIGNTLLTQEKQYNAQQEKDHHSRRFKSLNEQQRKVYDAVIESVENGLGELFFLYGPGGTGKTYLYNTIISKLRSEKKIVLPVASSGIAALLLPFGGKTVLLGGDFRQTLPVIPQGTRADTVLASIRQSYLWDYCKVFSLNPFSVMANCTWRFHA
uniref:ATP-dependent DNA helicase n=1 Tax=Noccaea caerulescens TaxID=107243 RepID=A0A1J3HC41_NOCCA